MENAVKKHFLGLMFFFCDGKRTMMAVTGIDPRNYIYESFSVHSPLNQVEILTGYKISVRKRFGIITINNA